MNEKLCEAMDHVGDHHIANAATVRRKKGRFFRTMVAAVLVIALVLGLSALPEPIYAREISQSAGSTLGERPDRKDYDSYEDFRAALDPWEERRNTLADTAKSAGEMMLPFLQRSTGEILGSAGNENRVWSPVSGYIALAMLAETTGGNSRAQILDLLGAEDTEELRHMVDALWETCYEDSSQGVSILANSLWLDKDLSFNQEVMDILAQYHHASVYQGELSSRRTAKDINAWLNNATKDHLDSARPVSPMSEEGALALISTVYFRAKWSDQFSRLNNTRDTFHAPGGDMACTYMNEKQRQTNYYWGESYGAVSLGLENGCRMWLILPDEDKTTDDVLQEGEYLQMIVDKTAGTWEKVKYMKVNLSVPKFDVQADTDLRTSLSTLGVTEIFGSQADFSPVLSGDNPIFVTGAEQSTRVSIDEEGVVAASRTIFFGAGAAEPPEEIIDFILDRPFVFLIAGAEGQILFAGVVNRP